MQIPVAAAAIFSDHDERGISRFKPGLVEADEVLPLQPGHRSFRARPGEGGGVGVALAVDEPGQDPQGHVDRRVLLLADLGDLDPAFRRPGRIDVVMHFPVPNDALRRQIVESRWHPEMLSTLNLDRIVHQTDGLSFAELEELRKLLESKVPEDGAIISNELARFLNGSDCIDGVWFGEEHPQYRGRFWWRKLLPTQPKERPSPETDLDEAQRRR